MWITLIYVYYIQGYIYGGEAWKVHHHDEVATKHVDSIDIDVTYIIYLFCMIN